MSDLNIHPKYICPSCKEVVDLIDLTDLSNADPHEFIYGRARCIGCAAEHDWMEFEIVHTQVEGE